MFVWVRKSQNTGASCGPMFHRYIQSVGPPQILNTLSYPSSSPTSTVNVLISFFPLSPTLFMPHASGLWAQIPEIRDALDLPLLSRCVYMDKIYPSGSTLSFPQCCMMSYSVVLYVLALERRKKRTEPLYPLLMIASLCGSGPGHAILYRDTHREREKERERRSGPSRTPRSWPSNLQGQLDTHSNIWGPDLHPNGLSRLNTTTQTHAFRTNVVRRFDTPLEDLQSQFNAN